MPFGRLVFCMTVSWLIIEQGTAPKQNDASAGTCAQRPIIAVMFVSGTVFLGNCSPSGVWQTSRRRSPFSGAINSNMPYDDPDDDDEDWSGEDWSDDDEDDSGGEEFARCPECGGPVSSVTDKCPSCGYWLLAADRRAMWSGERKPAWLRVTAWVVLAALLFGLLVAGFTVF